MLRATFTNDTNLHFDNRGYSFYKEPAIEQAQRQKQEFICELSHLGFLNAQGADTVDFLHSQLTNDLKHLPENYSQLSGYCTPKGRLLCVFRINHNTDNLLLQAHQDVIRPTTERLRKYVMRTKVELKLNDDVSSFGVVGRKCGAELLKIAESLPTKKDECLNVRGLTVICYRDSDPLRYQVIGAVSALRPLWQKMSEFLPKLGSWAWASMEIEQGLATIFTDTSEQFIPQMVNMDIINAVSFEKGCYPGQEIVARMHFLGKLKTRMILGNANTPSAPLPGNKLYAIDNKQSVGMVVDAMPGRVGYDILATARLENVQRDDLCLRNETEVPVELRQLPYQLDNPEQKQS